MSLPCAGKPKNIAIHTPAGDVFAVVCVVCGEGYGNAPTQDDEKIAMLLLTMPLDEQDENTYCDGSVFNPATGMTTRPDGTQWPISDGPVAG